MPAIRDACGRWTSPAISPARRSASWVSDLHGLRQGHADLWQVCLAHQLRDCQFAIDAGDTVFAPRMKSLLLRAFEHARRRHKLAESTRRQYLRRLDNDLDAVMRLALAPGNCHGRRLRKRYGKVRGDLFTFLIHPEIPPDNNASERDLRPTARRESLCKPSSSVCKHWKRVSVGNATRATFPGHRRFDRLRRQVVGPDLMRCTGNDLRSRKDAVFDKAPYRVVGDA